MAERKAINKYYPPDWDPSKGTVNQYVGQHPLRSRARKLDEGILIVRLALPFGIWCDGCNSLLAKGLRFNAEKKKARNYRSIPIWSFRIKCHSCSQQWIELQTNPEKFTYDVISGGRKKAEPEDATELDINYETLREEIIDMANGPGTSRTGQVSNSRLHELELVEYRKKRTAQAIEQLAQLKKESDKDWKNADQANSRLRELFRAGRQMREANKRESEEMQARIGISIPILPASKEDSTKASLIEYGEKPDEQTLRKRAKLECSAWPLFGAAKSIREKNTSLKAKIAIKQLGESDPLVSAPVGNFSDCRNLGIRPGKGKERDGSTDVLAELLMAYESDSSSEAHSSS